MPAIQQSLDYLIRGALQDAAGPTVPEALFVPRPAEPSGTVADRIAAALTQMGQEPLVAPTLPSPPPAELAPAEIHTAAPQQRQADGASSTVPSKPPPIKKYGLPLFTLGCWLSALHLMQLCDTSRFDPVCLLLVEPPARRTFYRWTLARLQCWVLEQFGVELSLESIRQALHRLGWSWKKARKLLAKADTEQRQTFVARLPALLAAAQQGQLNLIFIDEAHIHLDADLGYGWAERGAPFFVHSTSPGLQKVSFYGLYMYTYQSVRLWPAAVANSELTVAALDRVRLQFPEGPIAIIWDGASYHRSAEVLAAAQRLDIQLIKLPAYSPDLMPVEALWRWFRAELTAHHCHDSIAELLQRAADFQMALNLDPETLAGRLLVRSHLDPTEEKLRL